MIADPMTAPQTAQKANARATRIANVSRDRLSFGLKRALPESRYSGLGLTDVEYCRKGTSTVAAATAA